MEAIAEWRKIGKGGTGKRELCVKIVEEDGLWDCTEVWEPAPPPPVPKRRLVLKRDGRGNFWDAIKEWTGRG